MRTAHWIQEITSGGEGAISTLEYWLRLAPPALAWRSGRGDHDVMDARGHLHTAGTWKDCRLYPHSEPWSEANVLGSVLPWGSFTVGDDGDLQATPPARDGYDGRLEELNGRVAARFSLRYVEGDYRADMIYWLDPTSGLKLRSESVETDARNGEVAQRSLEHRYEYDVEVPAGTFDLPHDKPLVVEDVRPVDIAASLPPEVRSQIEDAINRSEGAWIGADFGKFAQVWFFPRRFLCPLPKRGAWKRLVLEQAGQWRGWRSRITSITRCDFVAVATGIHSYKLMKAPGTLWVKALSTIADREHWVCEVETEYFIEERRDRCRIVHWRYPSEELLAGKVPASWKGP